MADILITYDVSDKNKEMKVALKALGYMDNWKSNEQTYYLPNTTMWKKDTTVSQGIEDMQACSKKLQITLERAIAVPSSPWSGIPGMPHKS